MHIFKGIKKAFKLRNQTSMLRWQDTVCCEIFAQLIFFWWTWTLGQAVALFCATELPWSWMEWYWGWLQLRLESKVGARVNLGSSSPSSAAVNRTFRLHTSLRVWDLILEKTPLWFEMQNQNPTSSHWKFLLDQRNYNTVMLAWDLAHLLENMSCFTGNFTSLPGIRCDRWTLFCAICVIYHTRHILTILYVIVYIVPCERGGGWWYYGVVDLAGAWLCTL